MGKKRFRETVRGKVVIAFALIVGALIVTFTVNRIAFQKITGIIEDLSQPNEKLIALNELHRDVTDLMDLQRIEAMEDKSEPSERFLKETNDVQENLGKLRILFGKQDNQLKRIDSIDSLMSLRNKLFFKYLKVRYNYVKKGVLDKQLKTLSSQIENENLKIDSNVVTTEKSTKTTTIIPAEVNQTVPKKRKWFSKKPKTEPVESKPQIIVEEKMNVKVDTVSVASRDSILSNIEKSLQSIETDRNRSRKYVRTQERYLIETNDLLMKELVNVIREVENQEIAQTKIKNKETTEVAAQTLGLTRIIMVIFILVAVILAGLIISDVSKSSKYRNALEVAKTEAEYHSMAKQRFLANMSHEIRTPLQSIIGYSEQLSNHGSDENVKAIASSSQHLLQVVNEILDYSRIISGKFIFEKQVFLLDQLIHEVWKFTQLQAEEKGIQTSVSLPEEEISLLGDPFRFKQILYNLLGNAIKFTQEGCIQLEVKATPKYQKMRVGVTIRDTGRGMSKEDLSRIFNQFEQAQNTQMQSGTGLGLSIVKELIEGQGGQIEVKSELGKGSEFGFFIDYEVAATITENENLPTQEWKQFEGEVWVVDDDELILKLCRIIFDKYNIQYQTFSSAEALLGAFPDQAVKMIFADVRLPGMSGIDMTTELRRRKVQIPIIALTAQVLPEEKEKLITNGYDALLTKPFTENQLIRTLLPYSAEKEAKITSSLSPLHQMITDPDDLKAIIAQFKSDTLSDLSLLEKSLTENDVEQTALLVHRIAGRMAQMGESVMASEWRKMEINIRASDSMSFSEKEVTEIRKLCDKLHIFIQ